MVKFGPTLLNFLNSLILWFRLSNMQHSRAWDVTVANFEYNFALVDEIFDAFFRFATTLGWDICSSTSGSNFQQTLMSENIDFCQICFFPWTHCFFFLSTIALVKCIYGLNEAFCTKTRDKILSKKFLNLILRILCYPDLLKISAAILLFRKAQGKCHFERESPYDRFSSLFLGCICTFEVFILVFLYFVILYLQFFQLFFPESPGKMPLRTREPIWQVF